MCLSKTRQIHVCWIPTYLRALKASLVRVDTAENGSVIFTKILPRIHHHELLGKLGIHDVVSDCYLLLPLSMGTIGVGPLSSDEGPCYHRAPTYGWIGGSTVFYRFCSPLQLLRQFNLRWLFYNWFRPSVVEGPFYLGSHKIFRLLGESWLAHDTLECFGMVLLLLSCLFCLLLLHMAGALEGRWNKPLSWCLQVSSSHYPKKGLWVSFVFVC